MKEGRLPVQWFWICLLVAVLLRFSVPAASEGNGNGKGQNGAVVNGSEAVPDCDPTGSSGTEKELALNITTEKNQVSFNCGKQNDVRLLPEHPETNCYAGDCHNHQTLTAACEGAQLVKKNDTPTTYTVTVTSPGSKNCQFCYICNLPQAVSNVPAKAGAAQQCKVKISVNANADPNDQSTETFPSGGNGSSGNTPAPPANGASPGGNQDTSGVLRLPQCVGLLPCVLLAFGNL